MTNLMYLMMMMTVVCVLRGEEEGKNLSHKMSSTKNIEYHIVNDKIKQTASKLYIRLKNRAGTQDTQKTNGHEYWAGRNGK